MPGKTLSVSREDYLRTISALAGEKSVVRAKEIGAALKVKPSSVHEALRQLVGKGLIEHERYGYVRLTAAGAGLAARIVGRHEILVRFLRDSLGLTPAEVEEGACRMEHVVSETALARLVLLTDFLAQHPDWHSP